MNGHCSSTNGDGNGSNTIGCTKHTKRNHLIINIRYRMIRTSFISDKDDMHEKKLL